MNFPVTHSVLSAQALQKILEHQYDIPAIKQLNYFQAGLNDTYLLNTCQPGGDYKKYILRAYRKNWRNESDIRYEIDALNFLQKNNIPVATAISRQDGNYLTAVKAPEGLRFLVLFNYMQGSPPDYKNNYKQQATIYGQTFAKLHQTMKGFASPHQRFKLDLAYLLNDPLELIKPFLEHRLSHWQYLTELAEKLIQKYQQLPAKSLQSGFCHGDLNTENVHISTGEIRLFDFDCCGYGHHAADIAAFRWGARINQTEDKIWPIFLDAYLNESPLSSTDIESIEMFIAMRHIWHIGLHIQLSEDRGQHWINDNYFDQQIQLLKSWET